MKNSNKLANVTENKRCSYCWYEKPVAEFSLEHIWPDALGGDFMPAPWQTENVCAKCNSISGLWVDGAFIRSWLGAMERALGDEYRDPHDPTVGIHPFRYMGPFSHDELRRDEVAELWIGPCGAHGVHIRPKSEPVWDTYAGGKPSRKSADWGTALLAFTSEHPYWVQATLLSFGRQFRRAERISINSDAPVGMNLPFIVPDLSNSDHVRKIRIARSIGDAANRNQMIEHTIQIQTDLGGRLLGKIALGLGRELFGERFFEANYSKHLRAAFWERDLQGRAKIPVRGSGYLSATLPDQATQLLSLEGAWSLLIWNMSEGLCLLIATPSQRVMSVLIAEDTELCASLDERYNDGEVYVVVPGLGRALAISFPEFLAHKTGHQLHPGISEIEATQTKQSELPPCRPAVAEQTES